MTREEIDKLVAEAEHHGRWFLRRSNGGTAYEEFQWSPIGEWTEAPDWSDIEECGGGLHGNDENTTDCYWSSGKDLDFCVYEGPMVRIDCEGGKIKVKRAMVLLRNEFPSWLKEWNGRLDLRGTGITSLGSLQSGGGWLGQRDTGVKDADVPKNLRGNAIF
jgi:hypothetical protein